MSRWNALPIHVAEYFRPRRLLGIGSTWRIFAACFCSESDLLSQWRAYGSGCRGVAIGFRVRPFQELGGKSSEFGLVRIQYSPAELRETTQRMCDVALRLAASSVLPYDETEVFWSEVLLVLLNFAIRFKNPRFDEEKEWRALTLHTDDSPVFHRGSGDQEKRRYVHVHFCSDVVSQVVVGPLANAGVDSGLRKFLDRQRLQHVVIRRSEIPLRPTASI